MASELRVNTLKDASGNNSVATSVVSNGSAKAWFSYDADDSGNPIDDSFNLGSITDNGTGDATHAWTSSASGATYSFHVTCTEDAGGAVGYGYGYAGSTACRTNRTASNHRVTVGYAGNSALNDCRIYSYTWHGDLA